MSGFQILPLRTGWLREGVLGLTEGEVSWDGYAFGMVTGGAVVVDGWRLRAGMWFTIADGRAVSEGGSALMVVTAWRGLPGIGGPIEATGRLRYIDGCTDTLLVSPPRLGDPCLNHLHIPAGTDQSRHTHSSPRIGVIVRGEGECVADGVFPLRPGMAWYIPADLPHSFRTRGSSLDVMAWHPESDFGPTDEDHPMVNRTIVSR